MGQEGKAIRAELAVMTGRCAGLRRLPAHATAKHRRFKQRPRSLTPLSSPLPLWCSTSMPNIFIKGTPCGGCNDGPGVMTLQKEGKLLPMLKAAGAL